MVGVFLQPPTPELLSILSKAFNQVVFQMPLISIEYYPEKCKFLHDSQNRSNCPENPQPG